MMQKALLTATSEVERGPEMVQEDHSTVCKPAGLLRSWHPVLQAHLFLFPGLTLVFYGNGILLPVLRWPFEGQSSLFRDGSSN